MPSRSRPLGTALRSLILACGLMLLLIGILQFFPRWKAAAGLRSWVHAGQSQHAPAPNDAITPEVADSPDPFENTSLSGSVSGRAAGIESHNVAFPHENSVSTIEVGVASSDGSDIPPPPESSESPAQDSNAPEFQRLRQRVSSLERRATREQETPPADPDRTVHLLQQLEAQRKELRWVVTRLSTLEQLVQTEKESPPDASPPVESQEVSSNDISSNGISIRTVREGKNSHVVIEARNADLPEFLVRLGEVLGINLLISPDVAGTIWLHVSQADRDEALLAAICGAHQCRCERTGNFYVISRDTGPAPAANPTPASELVSKLYRLKHLTGPDVEPYVRPLLTPGVGTVSSAAFRERGDTADRRDPPHAILVRDMPSVLEDVDRLIMALDRPPAKAKLSSDAAEPKPYEPSGTDQPRESSEPQKPVLPPFAAVPPGSCTSVAFPAPPMIPPPAAPSATAPRPRKFSLFHLGTNRF